MTYLFHLFYTVHLTLFSKRQVIILTHVFQFWVKVVSREWVLTTTWNLFGLLFCLVVIWLLFVNNSKIFYVYEGKEKLPAILSLFPNYILIMSIVFDSFFMHKVTVEIIFLWFYYLIWYDDNKNGLT